MKQLSRKEVYECIDGERKYQDSRWGGEIHDDEHSVSEWLIFIRKHLNDAENAIYYSSTEEAMNAIRKITAMGVAAMESIGCPKRK